MKRRFLSFLLVLAMVLSMIPISVVSANNETVLVDEIYARGSKYIVDDTTGVYKPKFDKFLLADEFDYYLEKDAEFSPFYKKYENEVLSEELTTEPTKGTIYYSSVTINGLDGYIVDFSNGYIDIVIDGYNVSIKKYSFSDNNLEIILSYEYVGPSLFVGGVAMFSGDYLLVGETSTVEVIPESEDIGFAYYYEGELTLNNFDFEGTGYLYEPDEEYYAIIYSEKELNLNILGENTFVQNEKYSDSVYCLGNLNIFGLGSLNIEGGFYGIYAENVAIYEGNINISNTEDGITSNNITINDGNISIDSDYGIYAYENLYINGGIIEAISVFTALHSSGVTEIYGGDLTLISSDEYVEPALDAKQGVVFNGILRVQASETSNGTLGTFDIEKIDTYEYLRIFTNDVIVGGVGMMDGEYLANGATTVTTTKPESGYAYYNDGELLLSDYEYEGLGYLYDSESNYYAIIYSEKSITLILEGDNSLVQTDGESDGVVLGEGNTIIKEQNKGSLTIENVYFAFNVYELTIESGSLHLYDNSIAFFVDDFASVNGGFIDAVSKYTVFDVWGDFVVNGGTIDATSDEYCVEAVEGSIEINGGNVGFYSIEYALYAKESIDINGGKVRAASFDETGDYCAIAFADGSLNIASGLLTKAATNTKDDLGEFNPDNINTYKHIFISAPVFVGGIGMVDGDYLDSNASKTTIKPEGGYAYYNDGVLTLNNYEYEGSGLLFNVYDLEYTIIHSEIDIKIVLEGENTLKQTEENGDCIVSNAGLIIEEAEGNLGCLYLNNAYIGMLGVNDIIINSGDIHLDYVGAGMYSGNDTEINGGKVSILSGYEGITAEGNVTVNDGVIDINSKGTGIYSNKIATVNGGDINIITEIDGIYAEEKVNIVSGNVSLVSYGESYCYALNTMGTIEISDNLIVKASKTAEGELVDYVAEDNHLYHVVLVSDSAPMMGDLNGDGIVDAKDVTLLRRYVAEGWTTSFDLELAEFTNDGNIDAKDVTILRRYVAEGWEIVL